MNNEILHQDNTAEKIGYLIALTETLIEKTDRLSSRLQKVEDRLSTWSTIIKTLKFISGVVILLLTLKVGSIAGLWHKLFS